MHKKLLNLLISCLLVTTSVSFVQSAGHGYRRHAKRHYVKRHPLRSTKAPLVAGPMTSYDNEPERTIPSRTKIERQVASTNKQRR